MKFPNSFAVRGRMTQRWLLLLTLFAPFGAHAQTTAVSGNMSDIATIPLTTVTSAQVTFELKNFGGRIPESSGVAIGNIKVAFKPDTSGNFSGSVYSNGGIDPSGTYYNVCVENNGQALRCERYLISGATWVLGTATPLVIVANLGPNQLVLQTFPCIVTVAATTWTCTHNFNDSPVMVSVFDSTGAQIFPDATNVANPNVTTITFVNPQAGTALISHAAGISFATSQPNAVLQNPTTGQTIQGPSLNVSAPTNVGLLTCKNFENVRCADARNAAGWVGANVAAWINSAVADIGANPGLVQIAPQTGTGLWNAPPNSVAIIDQRFTNDSGLNEGQLAFQHSHWALNFHAGANDSYESNAFSGPVGLAVSGVADSGGFSGQPSKANVVGIFSGIVSKAASLRPVWGANFNVGYNAAALGTGLEIDLGPQLGDDTALNGVGLRLISCCTYRSGIGFMVNASNVPSEWTTGGLITNYKNIGLELFGTDSSAAADLYIVPAADDTTSSIIVRNHANSSNVFTVDRTGNVNASVFQLRSGGGWFGTSSANQAASGIMRLSNTDCLTWRNAANSGDLPLCADSSNKLIFGGNTVQTPVYNAAGTTQNGAHTVSDSGTLSSGTPSTVTITLAGSAAFTSSSSYNCAITNKTTQANSLKVTYRSGSAFVVTGPNTVTDSFSYICVGN